MNRRVAFAVLLAASGAVAADDAQFRLITSERTESLQRKLNVVAEDGYHAIAAGRGSALSGKGRTVVLLERNDKASQRHEYRVLENSGQIDAESQVAALSATGFRLTPGMILADPPDDWWVSQSNYEARVQLILERTDTSTAYEYDRFSYESIPAFNRELDPRMSQGFSVLGLVNTARRLRVMLERDVNADPEVTEPTSLAQKRYRMIIGSIKVGLRHQLNDAAAEGYRVISVAETGTHAPPIMLMEKLGKTGRALEYKPLYEPGKRIYNDKLEEKLNKRARKGFRITPGAVSRSVVVMQRTKHVTPAHYRVLSSRTPPGLSQTLELATEQGYHVVTMFVSGDETTVITEKPGE